LPRRTFSHIIGMEPDVRKRIMSTIAAACLLAGYTILACCAANVHKKNATLSATIRSYQHRFSQMIGDAEGFGHYNLVTLDGGLRWWNFHVEPSGDEGAKDAVVIDGAADESLLRYLESKK